VCELAASCQQWQCPAYLQIYRYHPAEPRC
jgi:hypothetical protein